MFNKLILGTVQFGLDYGINNSSGKPSKEEVFKILDFAKVNGINLLDTASEYGNSIDLIGEYDNKNYFNIISKFKSVKDGSTINEVLCDGLNRVKKDKLYGYLFHSFQEFLNNKSLLKDLLELKNQGKIKNIGVSVYSNEELEIALNDNHVELIQLPFNLLDNSNHRGRLIQDAKEKGKIIHTRSVFLQGLFFKDLNRLPNKLIPVKPSLTKIKEIADKYNLGIGDLALNYVISNPYIDGILIGVDNVDQLKLNLQSIEKGIPTELIDEIDEIFEENIELLNPSNW